MKKAEFIQVGKFPIRRVGKRSGKPYNLCFIFLFIVMRPMRDLLPSLKTILGKNRSPMMIYGEVNETSQTRFLLVGKVKETDQRWTKVADL
eukprot:12582454-Heterocapsa_arctica.AAC.1